MLKSDRFEDVILLYEDQVQLVQIILIKNYFN